MKNSEINFKIQLDDNNVPENITWEATDKPSDGPEETNAILISLWDKEQKNTMRIDLWSKKMTVDEMKMFYIDSIGGMAESLKGATGDLKMADEMQQLCHKLVKMVNEEKKNR